jgi:molecular chaperone GrpE
MKANGDHPRDAQEADMSDRVAEGETPVSEGSADTAALQAENNSLRERMLRALADAENTRRRSERAQREVRQFAIADFARELLPIVDNLQRTNRGRPGPSLRLGRG